MKKKVLVQGFMDGDFTRGEGKGNPTKTVEENLECNGFTTEQTLHGLVAWKWVYSLEEMIAARQALKAYGLTT